MSVLMKTAGCVCVSSGTPPSQLKHSHVSGCEHPQIQVVGPLAANSLEITIHPSLGVGQARSGTQDLIVAESPTRLSRDRLAITPLSQLSRTVRLLRDLFVKGRKLLIALPCRWGRRIRICDEIVDVRIVARARSLKNLGLERGRGKYEEGEWKTRHER